MVRAAWVAMALAACWGQDGGGIEGTVTNGKTQMPVAGARITVTRMGDLKVQPVNVTTQPDGSFRTATLPPGDYVAGFDAEGFVMTASPVVHVGGGVVRVNATLFPTAIVSGRVLDDAGVPAAGIRVMLALYRGGRFTPVKTDGEGRFVFPSVAPGVYGVEARPPVKAKDGASLAATWFPSAGDRAQAERVIVRAGAEVPGIEIRLRRLPVWTVQGTVSDDLGNPVARAGVKLRPADVWEPDETSVTTGSDGVFRFTNVSPGSWRLAATSEGREGFATVAVEKHDVERVALRVHPPFALSGRVERDEPRDAAGQRKVSAISLRAENGEGKDVLAFHQQDGSIRFERVQPGRYTIFPLGFLAGYYLDSVWLGDREVMSRPVELTNGALPIRVVYRPNAGRVRANVEKGVGSMVVLLPQDEALLDGQFIRASKCDGSGRVEVGSLRPGDYYAFAFDRVDMDALSDVTFARNLRPLAASVHVEEGKAADVDLKVTPWPE